MTYLIFMSGCEQFRQESAAWSGIPQSIRDEALRLAGLALSHYPACGTQEMFKLSDSERDAALTLKHMLDNCRLSEDKLEAQIFRQLSVWG